MEQWDGLRTPVAGAVGLGVLGVAAWWLWTWHLRPIEAQADRSVPGQIKLTITGPARPGFYVVTAKRATQTGERPASLRATPALAPDDVQPEDASAAGWGEVVCIAFHEGREHIEFTLTAVDETARVRVSHAPGKCLPGPNPQRDYAHCTTNPPPTLAEACAGGL